MAKPISILCAHGVGHGDIDPDLEGSWSEAICDGLAAWNPVFHGEEATRATRKTLKHNDPYLPIILEACQEEQEEEGQSFIRPVDGGGVEEKSVGW